MGKVYLAEDLNLGRLVALKILAPELIEEPEHLRRFEREARAVSALNHPNILTIYEIGESEGDHFIATEFIEGESLRQLLSHGPLENREALDVAIQTASALAAAHDAGIIHRDIKPENIMVRKDGLVKVLDFGLAKLLQPEMLLIDPEAKLEAFLKTNPGVVMGTTAYMSPEQARGREVDERADIWSLGVVLYELVTHNLPFAGDTRSDIIASILKTEPPLPLHETEQVPAALSHIVSKTLRKNCEDRYQHVRDLMTDLKDCKQQLTFSSKLASSIPPRQNSGAASWKTVSRRTSTTEGQSASSSEYIVSGIRRHKLAAFAVLIVLIGLLMLGSIAYTRYFAGSDQIDSLAVLPFSNETGDAELDYLTDGLSESLINRLSQLPGLKVIARSSSFRYRGKGTEAEEVAQVLRVRGILTGRVSKLGERLQISVELMDVNDRTQVWGAQYERSNSNLMGVQREIAQEISRNLRLKLTRAEESRVGNLHTSNAEAYELYLKGRFYWNKRTGEALTKSVDYFNQAIEQDPSYALAYAGLADAYVVIPFFSVGSPHDSYQKAKAAARRALEIDEKLAEAHTALAAVLMNHEWNLTESNQRFERAIELNPNYPNAYHWYSRENLTIVGKFDEALANMKRAQELDPLSLIINANLGKLYFNARRYDEAIAQLKKTIEIDGNFFLAHHYLGSAYAMKGSYLEAMAAYQKAHQINETDPHVLALLGRLFALTGRRADAQNVLAQLELIARERYVADYSRALVYAALDDKDRAFALLEKSYRDHSVDMLTLHYDPLIDNLRSDPRFSDLIRRIGIV